MCLHKEIRNNETTNDEEEDRCKSNEDSSDNQSNELKEIQSNSHKEVNEDECYSSKNKKNTKKREMSIRFDREHNTNYGKIRKHSRRMLFR